MHIGYKAINYRKYKLPSRNYCLRIIIYNKILQYIFYQTKSVMNKEYNRIDNGRMEKAKANETGGSGFM